MQRYRVVNTRKSITDRLKLPPSVDDAELFRIIGDALDVAEMVNLCVQRAAEEGEASANIGVGSPIDHAAKAIFSGEPGKQGSQEVAGASRDGMTEECALGQAFIEKLPQATRNVTAAKFAGWVRGRAHELRGY
ncbi:MAG TPA: hypothetical protein VMV98_08625 [Acidobacteriaceae bacterium]|nr:hypothetical protein [Acidobacteriaceae bacterium]